MVLTLVVVGLTLGSLAIAQLLPRRPAWCPPPAWFPWLGAGVLGLWGRLTWPDIFEALMAQPWGEAGETWLFADAPLSIVVLFLAMTAVALAVDVSGFLAVAAAWVLRRGGGSSQRLFWGVYGLVAVLTTVTSNDILILTLTPFLLAFLGRTSLAPLPFLLAEFMAANTFSMMLLVGNPTNIVVATAFELSFGAYTQIMWGPTLAGGVVLAGLLYWTFRQELAGQYPVDLRPIPAVTSWQISSVLGLGGLLLGLAIAPLMGWRLWQVALGGALIMTFGWGGLHRLGPGQTWASSYLGQISRRLPWEILPLLTGLLVLVQALQVNGVMAAFGTSELESLVTAGDGTGWGGESWGTVVEVLVAGVGTMVGSNFLNNLPMTVLATGVLQDQPSASVGSIYGVIVGSNLGANLTPMGALAGLMWLRLLREGGVAFSFRQFTGVGVRVMGPTVVVVCLYLARVLSAEP